MVFFLPAGFGEKDPHLSQASSVERLQLWVVGVNDRDRGDEIASLEH